MQELVNELHSLCEYFCTEAQKSVDGNKSAAARARKTSLKIEKAMKAFRKESVASSK